MTTLDLPPNHGDNNVWGPKISAALLELESRIDAFGSAGLELAYAENSTGTGTTVAISAAASALIPGCLITVPPHEDPVWVNYGATAAITVTGGGLISLEVWDVTAGGVGTQVHSTSVGIVSSAAVLYSGTSQRLNAQYRLEPSETEQVLRLKALMFRDAGSSLQAAILNSSRSTIPYGFTYIGAVHA